MAHPHVMDDVRVRDDRVTGRSAMAALAPLTHVVLRAGSGLLFMQHGMQKLLGMLGGFGGTPGAKASLMSQMGLAGALELVGGLLLVLGLFTRPVAAILCLEMLIAYVQAHLPQGGWPIQNGGELALLYAIVFAYLATHGAGPLSVDRQLAGRHAHL